MYIVCFTGVILHLTSFHYSCVPLHVNESRNFAKKTKNGWQEKEGANPPPTTHVQTHTHVRTHIGTYLAHMTSEPASKRDRVTKTAAASSTIDLTDGAHVVAARVSVTPEGGSPPHAMIAPAPEPSRFVSVASLIPLLHGDAHSSHPVQPDFSGMTRAQILHTLVDLAVKWADAPKSTKLAITLASGGSFCSFDFGRVPSLAAAAPLIAIVCAGPRPNVTGSGPGYLMPQWIQGKVHEGDATPYNPVDHPRVVRAHQIALLKNMVAIACTGTVGTHKHRHPFLH